MICIALDDNTLLCTKKPEGVSNKNTNKSDNHKIETDNDIDDKFEGGATEVPKTTQIMQRQMLV